MWFTETVQIVPKTRKTLQTHFSIIPDFFNFFEIFLSGVALKEKLKSS